METCSECGRQVAYMPKSQDLCADCYRHATARAPERCDVPDCSYPGFSRPFGYEGTITLCEEHARQVAEGALFRELVATQYLGEEDEHADA